MLNMWRALSEIAYLQTGPFALYGFSSFVIYSNGEVRTR